MKKFLSLLLLAVCITTALNAQSYTWIQKASLPADGRYGAVCFTIGSKAYVCCGVGNGNLNLQDLWEYDNISNTWTQKSNVPGVSRRRTNIEVVNGIAYMMGGVHWNGGSGNNTILKDVWAYNPTTDSWTQKNNLPFGPLGSAASSTVNDKIYFGIGLDSNQNQQNIWWMYNPLTDTWTQKASFPGTSRLHGVSFKSKDRIFFGLGITTSYTLFADLWLYQISTDTWVQKSDFPGGARQDAASFYVGDNGYIVGGYSTQLKKDVWEYNYFTDTWTNVGDFTGGYRRDNTGFCIGDKGYCGFGVSNISDYNFDLWEFTAFTDINENNCKSEAFMIFPNPASSILNIQSNNIQKIEIYDVSGKQILNENKSGKSVILNIDNYSTGIYFVKIYTTEETFITKLFKK